MNATTPATLLAHLSIHEVKAARGVADAIKAINDIDFTPSVAAHICAVLSARITGGSWSHFEEAARAIECLDDAHDALTD